MGNKFVRLTDNDMKLIFGIACGTRRILLVKDNQKPSTSFAKRVFSKDGTITRKNLKVYFDKALKKKNKESAKDVAQLLTLFLIATLFCPLTFQYASWSYLLCVEDLEETRTYAWSTMITDCLINELDKRCDKPKTVGGCIMGLMVKILIIVFSSIFPLLNCALNILFLEKQYFLSEHTSILPVMMVRAYFPRFMKWSLTRLTQELVNTPLESLEPGKVKSINT